jgi:tetratricopeptide (TPR) repeat protein
MTIMRISSPTTTKPGKYQAMDASVDAYDEKLASSIPKKSPTHRTRVSFSDIQEEKKVETDIDSSKQLKKQSSKKKLMKRFFGDKRKPSPQVQESKLDNDCDGEDPVMAIFQSRNTQRVRFSIEVKEADNQESQELNQGENVKQFMSRALFSSTKSSKNLKEEMEREVAELGGSLVWDSAETSTGPEVILTKPGEKQNTGLMLSYAEDPKVRAKHSKLLNKAQKAEQLFFRYEFAVKCYIKALNMLKNANYPDSHPTVTKTVNLLNNSHQVLSSYNNSVRIVKMGIKHEDSGQLVRALKMYTIAYRIRRDNLSSNHPSHVVLLNMLGSIQVKRGELKEAMLIYELALKDHTVTPDEGETDDNGKVPMGNLLAKSVTYREMGIINEQWGHLDEALNLYHKSLECVAEWKEASQQDDDSSTDDVEYSISNIHLEQTSSGSEMEVCLGPWREPTPDGSSKIGNKYESFFPSRLDEELERNSRVSNGKDNRQLSKDSFADMDLALTLHQIAQLFRKQGQFPEALEAFEVALRGMKYSLGRYHSNVAAVLGNVGNLQKEMGDLDAAYKTYQEVLGIESYRLGLSHPDVAITVSHFLPLPSVGFLFWFS